MRGQIVIDVAENIAQLNRRIRDYERRYGRSENSVGLLAVSKRQSCASIRAAAAAGVRDFGENYLQEAQDKIDELAGLDLRWHYIGPIQANKTRGIADSFDWVHSVDRAKIATRLNDQRQGEPLQVCVQVNLSTEASKSGVLIAEAEALCDCISRLPKLSLRGLMAIPAPLPEFSQQRACFRELAQCFHHLKGRFPGLDTLSMGMSNDFEAAIAEGATCIRLGTVVFGPRPT